MLAHIRRASVRAHNEDSQCWRATAAARSAADLDCAHGAAAFSMGCGWTRGPTHPPPVSAQAILQHPVVITSWKKIARIEPRGELEVTDRHGIAESQHVDLGWPGRNPPHSLVVDLDELTNVGKGMTEVVEQLSEVGARLTLVGVGPELERESRTVLWVS